MPRGHLLRATILQQICEWLQIGCSANINKPKIWDDLVYVSTCQYHQCQKEMLRGRWFLLGDSHSPDSIFWNSIGLSNSYIFLEILTNMHDLGIPPAPWAAWGRLYENPMVQKIKKISINCTNMSSMKPMTFGHFEGFSYGAIFEGHNSPIALYPSPEEHHWSAGLRSWEQHDQTYALSMNIGNQQRGMGSTNKSEVRVVWIHPGKLWQYESIGVMIPNRRRHVFDPTNQQTTPEIQFGTQTWLFP